MIWKAMAMKSTVKKFGNPRKASAGGIGALVSVFLVSMAPVFGWPDIPVEAAAAGGGIITWIASVFIPDAVEIT